MSLLRIGATDINTMRIDTRIQPKSTLRFWLYLSLSGFMLLLAGLADLQLWQYFLLLTISALVIGYLALSRPILLHLSQPPLSQRVDQDWQLLMRTARSDELWLSTLNKVQRHHWWIVFDFAIVEPFERNMSLTVFRDQVSADEWRELNILATVINNTGA